MEIDLFQENRNKDMKAMIKSMGANKSEKAIDRASRAAGGIRQIVDALESKFLCRESPRLIPTNLQFKMRR